MRIWHKILIAPILAIAFLLGFGDLFEDPLDLWRETLRPRYLAFR